MHRKLLLSLSFLITMSLFVIPAPAEAKPAQVPWNGNVVEVTTDLNSSWQVKAAMEDVDWYTRSDMRLVKYCSGKRRCVEISEGPVKGAPVGVSKTCKVGQIFCHITVDVNKAAQRRGWNKATKRWLIRHELGHYLGLGHTTSCRTMNPRMRCRGKVPPNTFNPAERSVLGKK